MKFKSLSLLLAFIITFSYSSDKPTLIFYCGITMVKPIKAMAKIIEKKHNCIIKISQGGSKDLYEALKMSKQGDLYLPGSASYRIENLNDGLLLDHTYIGYNQAALFVQKNNPKNIRSLNALINEEYSTILCNPKSGSIGKMTKKILLNARNKTFLEDAYDNTTEIGTDSRNLNNALIDKSADVTINWKATALWENNQEFIDIIHLDEKIAPKQKLYINLLTFSKHPKIAKDFMDFAASKQGQAIMKQYGFLN
jgi:molybdate transport system substrate-binding protein